MAVQNGNTPQPPNTQMSDAMRNAQQTQQQSQPTQGQPNTSRPGPRPTGRRDAGVLGLNNLLRRPISRNPASERVTAFQKAFNKMLDAAEIPNRADYGVHVLDAQNHLIALSTILVTYAVNVAGVNNVTVFQLVDEGSGPKLEPRYINIGNTSVAVEVTAADTINAELWDKSVAALQNVFGNAVFHNAGAMVLPVELATDDDARLQEVFYCATQAAVTVTENDVTGAPAVFNVSMVDSNVNVSATIDSNPGDIESPVGLPIRSNLAISTRAALNSNNQSLHETNLGLTRVDGFVNLIYSKPADPQWNQRPTTQHYYPQYVITRLDSQVDGATLELLLLALATTPLVGRQMTWSTPFLPRLTEGGIDLRDIGAIGLEVNLGTDPNAVPQVIPTKADSFGRMQLLQLLQTAIHDQVVYSIDVEEAGGQAWATQTFIAAANNVPGAYQAIIEAADNLTNHQFSKMWNNGPIAHDDNNRIHMGYYINKQGKRCDIRDIDYLGMLNLIGIKDMDAFHEWTQTYEDVNTPLELRLERRGNILRRLLQDNLYIKGFARRVTFYTDFIATLEQALQAAGLVIRPNNVQMIEGQSVQRNTFNASAFATPSQVGAGLFSFQQPNQFGGIRGGVNPAFVGRFGNGYGQG